MSNILVFPTIDTATKAIVRAQIDYERKVLGIRAITGATEERIEMVLDAITESTWGLSRRQALQLVHVEVRDGTPLSVLVQRYG